MKKIVLVAFWLTVIADVVGGKNNIPLSCESEVTYICDRCAGSYKGIRSYTSHIGWHTREDNEIERESEKERIEAARILLCLQSATTEKESYAKKSVIVLQQ